MLGGDLSVEGILELRFDFGYEIFHLFGGNGAFVAGFHDACKKLASVKDLACVILLDDDQGQSFNDLVGREAFLTGETFSAAADAAASFRRTGVDNDTFCVSANGTFHGAYLQDDNRI